MDYDIVCLSHLRWDFVYQRPQHLLTRAAKGHRVFYVEEPRTHSGAPTLSVTAVVADRLWVLVPLLPEGLDAAGRDTALLGLLDGLFAAQRIRSFVLWYYTPMALPFTRHLRPLATVYDCMDELSMFLGAPPELRERERELLNRAEVLFTGGASLFEAKRGQHKNPHLFPSSVDAAHFEAARRPMPEPEAQAAIPHPRAGYFGVIDERLDCALLAAVAAARPNLQLVMIGPLAKISEASLPRAPNLHWLGKQSYAALPQFIAHWEVALLPFALNDATQFISPTKTPEYLAAGRPVVSTSIRDVVNPYGAAGLAFIADGPEAFALAIDRALQTDLDAHRRRVDAALALTSWDDTWERMEALVDRAATARVVLRRVARSAPESERPR